MPRNRLSDSADWPKGVARHILETTDSTNAHGLRLAPLLDGPAWFMAYSQTAGRGRRARPWVSPRGNFYGSLILHPTEPVDQVALRSFVAALALRDAFVALTGLPAAFALKWPNDVLLNGGKVAGILLESVGRVQGVAHLAVGMGVNLITAPNARSVEPGAVLPVSVLAETGLRLEPEAFLAALAPAFARYEALFTTQGFAPIRSEWLAHAARLGEVIAARTGTTTRTGTFQTIDAAGNLILITAQGPVAIPAAEVFF